MNQSIPFPSLPRPAPPWLSQQCARAALTMDAPPPPLISLALRFRISDAVPCPPRPRCIAMAGPARRLSAATCSVASILSDRASTSSRAAATKTTLLERCRPTAHGAAASTGSVTSVQGHGRGLGSDARRETTSKYDFRMPW
jgi:hypothetical protein